MKILLLGEFSSLHLNLRDGLRALGHDAIVAASGDGWKRIEQDVHLGHHGRGAVNRVKRQWAHLRYAYGVPRYDVVQLINPSVFGPNPRVNEFYTRPILRRAARSFVIAAGDDAFYWMRARQMLAYTPFDDFLTYDHPDGEQIAWKRPSMITYNQRLVDRVDGVIPVIYDLYSVYAGHPKLRAPIPLPVNVDKVAYEPNRVRGGRLVIFHGLNREGFKGTRYITAAFDELARRYPRDVEVVVDGKLPYDEYLQVLRRVNVVVDQTNTYGWGMNAATSLAMGKIVLSGAEPEALALFGLDASPVINIRPDPADIVRQLERLLDSRCRVEEMGYQSRQFAERFHHHVRVAEQYVREWSQ